MITFFANLKARPIPIKALLMFAYGLLSFAAIWLIGNVAFDNVLIFRALEFFWFVHILIIANQISYGSGDLIAFALLGLAPGLLNNVFLAFNLNR